MSILKWIRYGAWAGVVVVAFVGAALMLGW